MLMVLETCQTDAQAGWVFPLLLLWIVATCSGFVAMMLCEAMQRIPGNHALQKRYEYSTLVRYYMGEGWYKVAAVAYNVSLLATNVAAVVITAQVRRFHKTLMFWYQIVPLSMI